MHLVAKREIAIYKVKCFKRALVYKKKKRKKLIRLNLLSEKKSRLP
jgi:hypothetical protein